MVWQYTLRPALLFQYFRIVKIDAEVIKVLHWEPLYLRTIVVCVTIVVIAGIKWDRYLDGGLADRKASCLQKREYNSGCDQESFDGCKNISARPILKIYITRLLWRSHNNKKKIKRICSMKNSLNSRLPDLGLTPGRNSTLQIWLSSNRNWSLQTPNSSRIEHADTTPGSLMISIEAVLKLFKMRNGFFLLLVSSCRDMPAPWLSDGICFCCRAAANCRSVKVVAPPLRITSYKTLATSTHNGSKKN